MAVGDVLKNIGTNLGNSVLGNIEKAKLYIHSSVGAEKINSQQVVQGATQALAGASAVGSAVSGVLTGSSGSGTTAIHTHEMTVQYNPSTLTIQANAESIPFTYLQQNIDNGIPNQNFRPPMVVLSVQLVFVAMNTQDAFMMDKLRLSVGSVVSDISAGIMTAKKGGYSVQAQTNGLIATVMRPSTKVVTFAWADMAFTGQITEVQANYTMFSPSGKPVRSTVTMNIAQQVESDSDNSYWDKVLDNTFGANGTLNTQTLGQTAGNLLNLNMF